MNQSVTELAGRSRKYESCKAIIQSLLISSTKGLTLQQLANDYHEIEGEIIPYSKLG